MAHASALDAAAALSTVMDLQRGKLTFCSRSIRRRVSDLADYFSDSEACTEAESAGNATVYEVYLIEPPAEPLSGEGAARSGALCYCSTVVHPGCVGDEYHMTRGHCRTGNAGSEVYLTLHGQGMLLLQARSSHLEVLSMMPGTVHYVPGETMARLVNTGADLLVAFSTFPATNVDDYALADLTTFGRLVVASPDGPDLVRNERFRGEL